MEHFRDLDLVFATSPTGSVSVDEEQFASEDVSEFGCPLFEEISNNKCRTNVEYEDNIFETFVYPDPVEFFLSIPVFSFLFVIGLFGNFLVFFVVLRNESMRTVTNIFLVNLAVADFLVILLCMPFTVLWDITNTWFFGTALCKIIVYTNTVSVSVSILTLTAISVERWYAICHPLAFKATFTRTLIIIGLIWVLSFLISLPELIVLQVQPYPFRKENFTTPLLTQCEDTWGSSNQTIYQAVQTIVLFFFPLSLMVIMYGQIARVLWAQTIPTEQVQNTFSVGPCTLLRHTLPRPAVALLSTPSRPAKTGPCVNLTKMSYREIKSRQKSFCNRADKEVVGRRKAAKMLIAVVALFGICYLPTHVNNILRCFSIALEFPVPFDTLWLFSIRFLCYFNSCINPLIYNFMSEKFRKEYRKAFICLPKKDRRRSYESGTLAAPRIIKSNNQNTPDKLSLLSGSTSQVNRHLTVPGSNGNAYGTGENNACRHSRSHTEFRSGELEFRSEVYPPLSAVL